MKAAILSVVLLSCTQHPNAIEQDFIDCTKADIGMTIPEIGMTLYQDVKTIIEAGAAGWQTALANLVLKYGNDALACALKATYDTIMAHPPATISSQLTPTAARVQQYINDHGFKYKP